MTQKPISVVVVTLNEEANIERCLRSVPFASELIVVDTFSSDRTVEIARGLGAKVVQEKWRGFGPQKKFAANLAQNDWVLSLDADEALSPELQQEIVARFESLKVGTAYTLPRKSFFLGRWIMHGGWYPDRQIRLFHKKHSQWNEAPIHEKVEAPVVSDEFRAPILHWVFDDISDQVRTNDRYSSLQAQERFARGERSNGFLIMFKPWVKFMECYFFKLGLLDGRAGLVIAVNAAYSVFLRHAKLRELADIKRRELAARTTK